MSTKRNVGLIVLIVGFVFLFTAHYIRAKVEEGKGQVSSAQQKVDTANSLFSLNKTTKQVGQGLTSPVQKKINEGKGQILEYSSIATWLTVGGVIFIIGGAGTVFLARKKRK